MKFLKSFLILVFFLFSLNLIFAHQPFYQVNIGQTQIVDEFGVCYQITNNGLFDILVPTNTSLEWYLFNQSHPSNIELNECFRWVELGDWKYDMVAEGVCEKLQSIECQNVNGDVLDDSLCENLEKPIYSTKTDLIDCTVILKRNNCVGDEYPGIEIRDWPDTGYMNGLWGVLFYDCGSTGDWCHRSKWDYKTCSVEYVGRTYTDSRCTEKKRCCDDNGNDNGACSPRNPNFIVTCLPDCPENQTLYGKNCKDEQWIEENSFSECGDSIIVNHKGMNDWEAETKAGIYGTIEVGGKCWMDRNIGATCDFSSSDYNNSLCYGWYYQWGHLEAYKGDFDPDYEERPASRTSWEGDPCTKIFGSNWRIPTKEELNSLHNGIDGTGGVNACINSNGNIGQNMWDCLKMPQSGYLDGETQIEGIGSVYWGLDYEGLVDGVSTGAQLFNSGSSLEYSKAPQWMGGNLRCIRDY